MRNRLGISVLTLAAGASLLAHALALATFTVVKIRVGFDVPPQMAEMTVYFEDPAATQPAEDPTKDPASDFEMGRPDATGYATHAVEGRREQAAREAPQDQPSLSLDPVGNSPIVDVPSEPVAREPRRAVISAPPTPPLSVPRESLPLASAAAASQALRTGDIDPDEWIPPAPEVTAPAAKLPAPESADVPSPPQVAAARRVGGTGADPAPQGDSEVDPFSVLGSAEFRAGKVTVRAGRQVKTRRPKIQLAGMVDLFENSQAQVVLRVSVDATGKVTDAQVSRSSGSNELDQPCRVAMYEWWFEPKKSADGKPIPDVFQFAINFR
jgi:TonB family protein